MKFCTWHHCRLVFMGSYLLAFTMLLSACAASYQATGGVTVAGEPEFAGRVAVFTFKEHQKELTDRFVSGLMELGYQIIEREFVQDLLLGSSWYAQEKVNIYDAVDLAKVVGADTVVVGDYTRVNLQNQNLNIRAIRIADKSVIFSVSITCLGDPVLSGAPTSSKCNKFTLVDRAIEYLRESYVVKAP